jgi:hypothetical protein
MSLNGVQLKSREIAALAHAAGWHDINPLATAVAVCSAESSRYTEAENDQNADGSIDRGLWQINSRHLGQTAGGVTITVEACFEPVQCAKIAHALWRAEGWAPWAAYTTDRYLDEFPGALNGIRYWQLLKHGLPLPP